MKTRTYTIENKFKDYKFSEGENLTELDLEAIASRSRVTYVESSFDIYDEDLLLDNNDDEFYSTYNNYVNLVPEEQQYDRNDSFQIGNNTMGGI